MIKNRLRRIITIVVILSLGLLANTNHLLPTVAQAQAQSAPPTSVYVTTPNGTNNVTDLSKSSKSVTFTVNVALAPSLDAFLVFLSYNTTVFSYASLNYTGNVLGQNALIQRFCVDDVAQPGSSPCQPPDGLGIISFALYLLGTAATQSPTSGVLFQVTFNRIGTGLGQIHVFPLDSKLVRAPTGSGYAPFIADDAYYTNIACPPNTSTACKPPVVTVNFSPQEPARLSPVDLNATVVERNVGAVVKSYSWDFGDSSQPTTPINQSSTRHSFAGECALSGACAVTVTVSDTDSVSWQTTIIIPIRFLFIKLSVSELSLDYPHISATNLNLGYFAVPGTIIRISAKILNDSTLPENATITLSLDGKQLNHTSFTLNPRGSQFGTSGQIGFTWDTTGYSTRVYELNATISNIISAVKVNGAYITGENKTLTSASELNQALYIFLIVPQSAGLLSLSLLQTTGLAALVIVGVGFGVARFRKRPSYESEPL